MKVAKSLVPTKMNDLKLGDGLWHLNCCSSSGCGAPNPKQQRTGNNFTKRVDRVDRTRCLNLGNDCDVIEGLKGVSKVTNAWVVESQEIFHTSSSPGLTAVLAL